MTHFVFFETPPDVLERTVPLRAELTALQMQWALLKLARKYNLNQPRVPAGDPDGGQWTDTGGSSGWVRVAARLKLSEIAVRDGGSVCKLQNGQAYIDT